MQAKFEKSHSVAAHLSAVSAEERPQGRVSICLCFKQEEIEAAEEHPLVSAQIEHLYRIYRGLDNARITLGDEPLHFQVIVYILPKDGTDTKVFNPLKTSFFMRFEESILIKFLSKTGKGRDLAALGIEVRDFSDEAHCFHSEAEYEYIKKHQGIGTLLDMMKINSMIDNRAYRHVQIDSNTQVHDFFEFYRMTFAAGRDQFNAIYYADHFIGAHNKVVYLTPHSPFVDKLTTRYNEFIARHKKDTESKGILHVSPLYTEVFLLAAAELRLVVSMNKHWVANVMNPRVAPYYAITRCIVAAVRRSWDLSMLKASIDPLDLAIDEFLCSLQVPVGDARVDYGSLSYLIKKYSNACFDEILMTSGRIEISPAFELGVKSGLTSVTVHCGKMRGELIRLSNIARDFYIIRNTYLGLIEQIEAASTASIAAECKDGAKAKLAQLFLINAGLTQIVLGCLPEALIANPSAPSILLKPVAVLSGGAGGKAKAPALGETVESLALPPLAIREISPRKPLTPLHPSALGGSGTGVRGGGGGLPLSVVKAHALSVRTPLTSATLTARTSLSPLAVKENLPSMSSTGVRGVKSVLSKMGHFAVPSEKPVVKSSSGGGLRY